MSIRALSHAATALACAAAGWWAHRAVLPAPAPLPVAAQRPVAAPIANAAHAAPVIAVSGDGNVTLRVEQQPLAWVLEQIAMQGGGPHALQPAPAVAMTAAAPAPASCPEVAASALEPALVLRRIEAGTEAERFQGLMLARSAAITVPEPTLKLLFESGASERVQVAAFEAYLALHADRPDALRAALEAAQYAPTAAIQREAGQRLKALPVLAGP